MITQKILLKYQLGETKIKICLKNGQYFAGRILKITDNEIFFLDKFGQTVLIDVNSISSVVEVGA